MSPACQISLGILGETPSRRLDYSFHEDYHYALRSALTPSCGSENQQGHEQQNAEIEQEARHESLSLRCLHNNKFSFQE